MRITRRKEKEAIKRELKEAVANTAETEKKMRMLQEELQAEIRKVQEESQAQFQALQAQFSMLLQVMNSKGTQPQAQVVGSSILPGVPVAST